MGFIRSYLRGFVDPTSWRRLYTSGDDRRAFTTPGPGFLIVFAPHLVFSAMTMCGGLFGILAWPFGFRHDAIVAEFWPAVGMFLIGTIFTAFLSLIILGRQRIFLDRSTRKLTDVYGIKILLFPFIRLKRKEHPFEVYRAIRIQSAGHADCNVRLDCQQQGSQMVMDGVSEALAREVAEDLARFLNLPVIDASSESIDPNLERAVADLDLPLRERLLRGGGALPELTAPPYLSGSYVLNSSGASVVVPRPRLGLVAFVLVMLVCALAAVATGYLRPQHWPVQPVYHAPAEAIPGAPGPPSMLPYYFKAVLFVVLHGAFWLSCVSGILTFFAFCIQALTHLPEYRLHADCYGLRVRRRRWLIPLTTFLPQEKIEELRAELIPGFKSNEKAWRLVAVTDREFIRFIYGLNEPEARYLKEVLTRGLMAIANTLPKDGVTSMGRSD